MFNYDLSLRVTSSGSFLLPISPFHTLSQSLTSIFVKVQQLYLSKIKFILSLTHTQGITALSLDVSTLSSSLSLSYCNEYLLLTCSYFVMMVMWA